MKRTPVYLDYNATTPCDPRVVETMLPYFTANFGNPASADHWYGWQAAEAVSDAREQIARLIGASSKQIIFTSGATEAINIALKGITERNGINHSHIITCKTEHNAVLDTCRYLESKGCRISWLDVDQNGEISVEQLENEISPATTCVALMYANNETGVITDIQAVTGITRKHNLTFFCDATQAVGKMPVDVVKDGIDMMAFSSHKIYGPKGVGALYIKNKNLISPLQHGGNQEGGLRSGTLNLAGIAGFGKAADLCGKEWENEFERLRKLRDQFEQYLLEQVPGIMINGHKGRLPHVSNIIVPHPNTEQLLLSVSPFLAISRGSACTSLVHEPSHVLKAMGCSDEQALRGLRISLGRFTTEEEIKESASVLAKAILSGNVVSNQLERSLQEDHDRSIK